MRDPKTGRFVADLRATPQMMERLRLVNEIRALRDQAIHQARVIELLTKDLAELQSPGWIKRAWHWLLGC